MAGNKLEEDADKTTKEIKEVPGEKDLHIKHPLHNQWSLWYYESDRKKAWEDNLKKITSFDTVEDFWSLYNHIKSASELKVSNDYYLFKSGIMPMWEDDANKLGGKWVFNIDKKSRDHELDNCWLEVMLCLIGESFEEHTDEICGATVNIRPKVDKISVWTASADKPPVVLAIGKKLKERLQLGTKHQLTYTLHADAQLKGGLMAKNAYVL